MQLLFQIARYLRVGISVVQLVSLAVFAPLPKLPTHKNNDLTYVYKLIFGSYPYSAVWPSYTNLVWASCQRNLNDKRLLRNKIEIIVWLILLPRPVEVMTLDFA